MTKRTNLEIIKAGDRVITPEGPGFVLSEIMGRKFSVKLDKKPKFMMTDTLKYWREEIITVKEGAV